MGDKEKVIARLEGIKLEPIKDVDYHTPLKEFMENVKEGNFVDYDGHGVFATEDEKSSIYFTPSELKKKTIKIPAWATHVVWYNE